LAITGTNGKTTVTALTTRLLTRAGQRVAMAGNIGPTLLDTLRQALDAAALQQAQADATQAQDAKEAQEALAASDITPTPDALSEDALASQMPLTGTEVEAATDETTSAAVADDEAFEVDLPPLEPPPPPPPDHPYLPQVWVLELSSFQLDGVDNFEPTAAAVLNLTQDHLDWHGSMASYGAAKARIFGQQGVMVLNREDAAVMAMLPEPVRVKLQKPQQRAHLTFGGDMPQRPGDYGIETVNGMTWLVRALEADETQRKKRPSKLSGAQDEEQEIHFQRLMPADALRIRGRHNALNALAALALAGSAGGELAPMLFGLREYTGEPHRVASVAILNEVEYVDDSKGTNVGATVAALQGLGMDRRLVVILGGDGKGQDFSPLLAPVSRYARAVVLIGRDAPLLRDTLHNSGVVLLDAVTLEEAVRLAHAQAKPGDAVLLSPACASMDMFRNYAHRADVFVSAVNQLVEEAGGML
jgi:UDP-N-acetylmuramoylalanine--D-glutamate ligase